MAIRVNGGIINSQTLTGSLRYFKLVGPFAWTVSNGSVNLPVRINGGDPITTTYFVVGDNQPVPGSAADLALQEISKQCDITIIGLKGNYGATTEVHIACSASAFGWGSSGVTPAATEMQAAVAALGNKTVYVSVGAANPSTPPATAVANLAAVTITEVPFILA